MGELEKKLELENNVDPNVRGIKVRGVYSTQEYGIVHDKCIEEADT